MYDTTKAIIKHLGNGDKLILSDLYQEAASIDKIIDGTIASAVQAEREACAVIVEKHLYLPEHEYIETCEDMTDELAIAIRARQSAS